MGADIRSLTKEAAAVAIDRVFSEVLGVHTLLDATATGGPDDDFPTATEPIAPELLDPLYVTMDDFVAAVA